jgi:NAD(P)-dependent dehydrogenase (short-subunit alcohol dehydrogenase family)
MRLEGKVAVVTGAGSGIGRAMAQRFVEEGASVVVVDWHTDAVFAAAREIGGSIAALTANVAIEADATAMIDKAVGDFGRIDVLVNNAGVMDLFQSVADVDNETWRRVMSVNVDGPMFAMRRAVPLMLAQGGGAIVNIASVAGLGGGSAGAAYTASKHALIGLTRSTAFQYAKTGLRCNAIASGGVETNIMQSIDQTKIDQAALARLGAYHAVNPGMLQPVDLANLALFLASEEARHVNGAIIPADMGWRSA